jgi:hypothetical protein
VDPDCNITSGVDYILCFNNTLLNATSLASGEFFSGFDIDTYGDGINNNAGTVDYCELIWPVTGDGVTTPGTFTTITFQAIGDRGISDLYFKKVTLSDPDGYKIQNVASYGGRVGIAQTQSPFVISGYVSYKDGNDCNDPAVNITNLNLGKEWAAVAAEGSNYYQLTLESCADVVAGEVLRFDAISPDGRQSRTTERTVTQAEVGAGGFVYNITLKHRLGDVNGDGRITPADAAIALQMAVRGEYSKMADVSDDNSITSLDALMILREVDEDIT